MLIKCLYIWVNNKKKTMTNQFTIYKQYKDETIKTPVLLNKFIEILEGNGYYKKDTALSSLKECGMIQTNWAWYTIKYK